jgi:hypothetical protein
MIIKREVKVKIEPTVPEIVDLFWDLDSNEQAHFFSLLGFMTKKEDLDIQIQSILESEDFTKDGFKFFGSIFESFKLLK